MIRFTCKQCGKEQSRPPEQAGRLVFCTCGQANRVPWESEPGAAQEENMPVQFPKVWVDEGAGSSSEQGAAAAEGRPVQFPKVWVDEEARRTDAQPPRSTGFCFNHAHTAAAQVCNACRMEFCDACVVKLGEQVLCGPCKNFQILSLSRPPRASVFAIIALVLGIVGGPVATCITFVAVGAPGLSNTAIVLCVLGLVMPAVALVLGIKALRTMEKDERIGGRSLAVSGLIAAIAGILWCLTVIAIVTYRLAGGG